MAGQPEYVRLDGGAVTLVLALVKGGGADLVYLGARLPDDEELATLAQASARAPHESQPDIAPVPGLFPERKGGWGGTPALEVSENGVRIDTDLRVVDWSASGQHIAITLADERLGLALSIGWQIDDRAMVGCAARIINGSSRTVTLDRLASLAVPIPARFTEMTTYSGRWAGEMREDRRAIAPTGFARASAIGKPGFGAGNWLLLHAPDTGETIGAHLAWSGDCDTRIESDSAGAADGRAMLMMAAHREPGEIALAPGESFATCSALFAHGGSRDAVARSFHAHLRHGVMPLRRRSNPQYRPRKVHLNSWEALGFDLTEPDLFALAESAAQLGVERFVLDDGWFGGRRDDRTSLGDWFVSPEVFPDGLNPLIDRVHAKGMDFGLWVEPEMVSPDSDLYRAHPDWCLYVEGRERPTMRNQLVLDLTREDVCDHVFERLDALLRTHDIAYLKWDHNRDLFPSAGKSHAQTTALYRLIDQLRSRHPEVEIESCSSGGGRIDYGILARVHRVWPSDNNDPVERLRIIRAWSQFLPLEVLGNHVGPSPNPITGRSTSMDFRARIALFGHMGVEADPRAMSGEDRAVLAAHIALYKDWRDVLHGGELWRIDHADPGVGGLMATHDNRALALIAQTQFAAPFDVAPVRLAGLEPDARYRVSLPEPRPAKAARYLAGPEHWRGGIVLSGRALMTQGLALPLSHPETAWLIALERFA